MHRYLYAIVGCVLLTSCKPSLNTSVTIPQVVSHVRDDLAKAQSLSLSHFLKWTPDQKRVFTQEVQLLQCEQQKADPITSAIHGEMTLQLVGSFTMSGGFSVGAVLTAPSLSLSSTGSKTNTQTLSLPITYIPISQLPNEELYLELSRQDPLYSNGNGNSKELIELTSQEKISLIKEKHAFEDYITPLVTNYQQATCKHSLNHGLFLGTPYRGNGQ